MKTSIRQLIGELVENERSIASLDMSLFEGTGTAPPAYSSGVDRFNQIVAELCSRRDEVTPILEQLMSTRMDGVTETTLLMLKSALRQRAE